MTTESAKLVKRERLRPMDKEDINHLASAVSRDLDRGTSFYLSGSLGDYTGFTNITSAIVDRLLSGLPVLRVRSGVAFLVLSEEHLITAEYYLGKK